MAVTDLLAASGVRPAVVAGHSVGELGALYAAGALAASDVVTLIRERAGVMAGSVQGTAMMALAGEPGTWAELVDTMPEVHLACENSTGQVVVGGRRDALEALAAALAPTGTRCQMLPNEGAFHTPYFEEPETRFRQRVGESGIAGAGRLSSTMVSSVSGEIVTSGAEGLDLVLHQIGSPVRFTHVLWHLGQMAPDVVVQMSGGTFLLSWTQGVAGLEHAVKVGFGGPNATARDLATTVGQLFVSVRGFSPAVVYGGAGVASRAVRNASPLHSVLDASDRRDHRGQRQLRRRMVEALSSQLQEVSAPEPAPVGAVEPVPAGAPAAPEVLAAPDTLDRSGRTDEPVRRSPRSGARARGRADTRGAGGVVAPATRNSLGRPGLVPGVLDVIAGQNEVITALVGSHGSAVPAAPGDTPAGHHPDRR